MSKSRAKGTSAETEIVNYLNAEGIRAKRNPLAGARDVGDIDLWPLPVVVEVKNCKEMKLAEWIGEAEAERVNAEAKLGVVWHKRVRKGNPAEWYVTMSGEQFVWVLRALGVVYKQINSGYQGQASNKDLHVGFSDED